MIKTIYPFSYTWLDYPNNYSYALSIYCLGCDNNCNGCQTPELKSLHYEGDNVKVFDMEDFEKAIDSFLTKTRDNKICLIGGDFLSHFNIDFTKEFLQRNKSKYEVCIYTGHNIEYVKKNEVKEFSFIKCGKFDIEKQQESKKTDDYFQLASSNQKIYDSNFNLLSENGIYYFK